jgi:hypothetical protein
VFLEQASIAIVVENLGVFAAWAELANHRDHFGPMLVALILGWDQFDRRVIIGLQFSGD